MTLLPRLPALVRMGLLGHEDNKATNRRDKYSLSQPLSLSLSPSLQALQLSTVFIPGYYRSC